MIVAGVDQGREARTIALIEAAILTVMDETFTELSVSDKYIAKEAAKLAAANLRATETEK